MAYESEIKWVNAAADIADGHDTKAAEFRRKKADADNAGGLRKAFNAIATKPYYARKLAGAEHDAAEQRQWMQPRMAEILNDMGRDAVIERDGPDSQNAKLVQRYDQALYLKTLGELIDAARPEVEEAAEKAKNAEFWEMTDIIPGNAGLSLLSSVKTAGAAEELQEAVDKFDKVKQHLERGSHRLEVGDAAPEVAELFKNRHLDTFISNASELVGGYTSYKNAKKLDKAAQYMLQVNEALVQLQEELGPDIARARKDEMALVHKARDVQTDALMDKAKTTSDFDAHFVKRLSNAASYDPNRPSSIQNTIVQAAGAQQTSQKLKAPGRKQG